MNKLGILLKYDLIMSFGLGNFRAKLQKGKGKFAGKAVLSLFLGVLVLSTVFLYLFVLASGLKDAGLIDLLPVFLQVVAGLVIFFFTFYVAGGMLFTFKDYDLLMSMPISEGSMLASKVVSLSLTQTLLSALIIVPGTVVYAVMGSLSPLGWVYAILSVFLAPLVPVVAASIIAAVIGAISARMRFKNLVNTLLTFAFFILIMVGSFNLQNLLTNLIKNAGGIAEGMKTALPFLAYYGSAMATGSILDFLIAAAIGIAVFVLFILVFSKGYRKINQLMSEKRSRANYKMTELKTGTPFKALYKKEWKTLFGTPIYIFNTGFGPLLMLIVTVGILFFGGDIVGQLLEIPEITALLGPALAIIFSFIAAVSCTTASSISLEGKSFYLIKAAPVRIWTVFMSKILVNVGLVGVPSVLFTVILSIALKLDAKNIAVLVILPLLYTAFTSLGGLLINLLFPKMDFTSPTQVVKQSAAVLYTMLASMASIIVPIALLFVLNLSPDFLWSYIGIVGLALVAIDTALVLVLNTYGKKLYRQLQA